MRQQLTKAIKYWHHIAPVVKYPQTDQDFNLLVTELDELLEIVGNNENHQLMGLVDLISNLISSYEEEHSPPVSGISALKFLMEQHHLRQSDLQEIFSQGVLSEILQGKRQLNLRQIKLLAKRFHVNITTFIEDE